MIDKNDLGQRFSAIKLDASCFPEALKILTGAFRNDPMITHMFPQGSRAKDPHSFFEFLLMKSILLNEMLFGLELDGKLVAVANLEAPIHEKPGVSQIGAFIYQCLRLIFRLPFRSFIFINNYMKSVISARPKRPHHYLIFIGVDPDYQGKGCGRLMLEHVHSLVDNHPASSGIGLDTENPENVHLYEHFGYRLTATEVLGPVKIYNMFRTKV